MRDHETTEKNVRLALESLQLESLDLAASWWSNWLKSGVFVPPWLLDDLEKV